MKRKNLSKFVALALAGAMMIAPLPVSAAEIDSEDAAQGSTSGDGNVEGIVNKDVFKVELPTIPDDGSDTTFDFILDPQGLIKDTNGAAHTGDTFDENAKGLYFANPQDGGGNKYMASSPALTAKNKGTTDVDVTLTATANTLSDSGYTIGLSEDETFTGDKSTSIYLALVSGDQTAALTKDGATITNTLSAAPEDAYEVTYDNTNSNYVYGLTAAAQAADYTGFDSLDFNMTGACNTAADWAVAKDATPGVDVAWELERHFVPMETDGSVDAVIPYKGTDPAAGSLTFYSPSGTEWQPGANSYPGAVAINTTTKTVSVKATTLTALKTKAGFGTGTYTVTINGKERSFVLVDQFTTTPESDGTTDIVISYTGADPAIGSLTFYSPSGTEWAPTASSYPSSVAIDTTAKTVSVKAATLANLKPKAGFGTGTYTVTINGTTYSFILK